EADGHLCHTAATLHQASEILLSEQIDGVTLDLDAHGGSVLDWLDRVVLAHPQLRGRAFILADRLLDRDESIRLLMSGARVVRKPFTLDQVRETVDMMTP